MSYTYISHLEKKHLASFFLLLSKSNKYLPSSELYEQAYADYASQENLKKFFCISENNSVIATGSLHVYIRPQGGKFGIIEDVIVDESFRKRGIGNALMKLLLEEARKLNLLKISLVSSVKGQSLYEGLNFKKREDYYELNL